MARDSKGKLVKCGNVIEIVTDLSYKAENFLRP